MVSRKKLAIAASTICLVTVALFLQIGVFANQTQTTTTRDFTVDAADYDVFHDCNRDGKVDMVDIFGCILRYGTEGDAVRTSYLSVPHSAFNPITETISYYKWPYWMQGADHFYAEVYLPHGANVTGIAVYLNDGNNAGRILVQLHRVDIMDTWAIMAEVDSGSLETPGSVKMVDDTIDYPIVNNNGYAYQLYLQLTSTSNLVLFGVIIGYDYTP